MSEKNVHQLQWKQKNPDQSIYASRNVDIQPTTPIANQPATAAATQNHSTHSTTSLGTASNGRYPIIVSSSQQIPTSPGTPTTSTTPINLQHFHHMQHLQQQQQQQQQQLHQQHFNHHHQQNPHFELSKIMAINSGSLSRLDLPPTLGNHPVSSAITENVLSLIGISSGSNRTNDGIKIPDEEKLRKVQAVVDSSIGDHAKQEILQILDRISTLKPVERLLLYLRMPGETPESDPLRQPQNPLGTRSEINHTINWVRSHLEHDLKVSIPKQDVYNDYIAYCERLDIKPLSTADFGKVMKQVFPEIRPRRLGTRGHSRYCYAAMRKTTRLTPPQLPVIGGRIVDAVSSEIECDADAESWNTVRHWAEGLLNTKFESISDLAEHINKNEYGGVGAGSSRIMLQKKLLQRDAKEKRVYGDSGPLKKRRKKKRKGSTSSESSTTQHASSVGSVNEPSKSSDDVLIGPHTIKQEILDSPNSQPRPPPQLHLHHPPEPFDSQLHGHQLIPMNLATENERGKTLAGSLPINSPVAKNLTKTIADLPPSVSLLPIDPQIAQLASVKEEIINDEYNPQNVICKKVRRAHLAKGILATNNHPSSTITTATVEAQSVATPVEVTPATTVGTYSMGPPAQITTTAMESAKLASQHRARKVRLLQAHSEMYQTYDPQQNHQHQHMHPSPLVDNVEITEDKDVVLPENLGLPRERVISICNMDKHELDDYLNANDEENSQDQEAELLQYFQTGDAENNNKAMHQQLNIDAHNPTLAQINTNSAFEVPNKKKSTGGYFARVRDDLTQLRNYLHQNLNKDSSEPTGAFAAATAINQRGNALGQKCPSNGNHYIMSDIYNEGSASASLAIMSQKHLNETVPPSIAISATAAAAIIPRSSAGIVASTMDHSIIPVDDYTPVSNNGRATQKRKINLNAMVPAPSTTQRRKNCTFSPISPNINLANITTNSNSSVSCTMSATTTTNLFASPRLTAPSVRTKPVLHKQQSLPAAGRSVIPSANDPMIGANRNNRSYSTMASASAPPSPSILQDTMMFSKNYTTATGTPLGGYNLLLSNQDYQQSFMNSCGSSKLLSSDQNSLECVLDEPPSHLMAESRSRSVPLQYRNSPAFNQTGNYAGFSSTCSSAAQTPVPPQFADFSDPSSILDIFSDASQTHGSSIKMEESTSSLLSGSVADILRPEYGRSANSFGGIVSRSVPSTPLPLQNMIDPFLGSGKHQQQQDTFPSAQSKYSTKMYDISKSMPTTPITSNTATPSFRYSPEFNRDFLINGNTVESTPAYSRAPSVAAAAAPSLSDSLLDDAREGGSNSLTDGMDDLGSFDEVSESIIEADILNMNNL